MHGGKYFFLCCGIKINKHVAATDKIHARKGRVAQNIVRCKHTHFSDFFCNTVIVSRFGKETIGIFFRNRFHVGCAVFANTCIVYGLFAQVGSKNLHGYLLCFFFLQFGNQYGNRISFLARRAGRYPYTQRFAG